MNVSSAFDLRKMSLRDGALHFIAFAALGLPLAFAIGFIQPAPHWPEIGRVPSLIAGIFLLNALPEEILFRGIIQHSIESATRSRIGSLILAALVFGAAHLNNGPAMPNYRYFGLATLAGIFYGLAWRRNRNVLTSTITHTLVNAVWSVFFR
jgi:membrane protease YdiL (CAAX protease family)